MVDIVCHCLAASKGHSWHQGTFIFTFLGWYEIVNSKVLDHNERPPRLNGCE